jgi:thiamine biosynthesis protein ThiI
VSLVTPVIAVAYAEIALKGKNRPMFQRRLINNIRAALRGEPVAGIDHVESRLLVRLRDPSRAAAVTEKLTRVFGIQWLSPAVSIDRAAVEAEAREAGAGEPPLTEVCAAARALARARAADARHFKVETRRSDRSFVLESPDINRIVGAAVGAELRLPARMAQPDLTINILVMKREILIFAGKLTAHGGLPAGVSGRICCLLSGGIDSPVAAWLMMRRGCRPEFVHFYSGRTVAEADTDKIEALVRVLAGYSPVPLMLRLIPVVAYELRAIGQIEDRYDMVMFRRFMFKAAARLAWRHNCHGLVTGDSLGQVASQTLLNLAAISPDVTLPILRPLIGMDKLAITALSERIGAFELSILPYRDCCSIRSPRPILDARADELLRLSGVMDLDAAIDDALAGATELLIGPDGRCEREDPA